MRFITYIFVFVGFFISSIARADYVYTCSNACYNYHLHKCTSPIDDCGYSCLTVCEFFSESVVSQRDIKCISISKTCKEIFACLGY